MKKGNSLLLITFLLAALLIVSVGLNIYLIKQFSDMSSERLIQENTVLTQQPQK